MERTPLAHNTVNMW